MKNRISDKLKSKKYRDKPFCQISCRVPFYDIDVMEVVWHGNYAKYFEVARCAVLREIGYDYPQMKESGYAWPIVDIRNRFIKPASYNQILDVWAVITEWEVRLGIEYFIYTENSDAMIARGWTYQVPVSLFDLQMQFGCPDILPERVRGWQNIHVKS